MIIQEKNISRNIIISGLISLTLFCFSDVYAEQDDKLQFSGFARVVMGHLDDENAEYIGYGNAISFDQQTLLGLQADFQITDSLSVTGQVIGHTGTHRESGLEWLYLSYSPSKSLQFKIGRQRTPFFNYSDIIDVGFAYPWITTPQQVYSSFFFSSFDGVMASYEFAGKEFIMNFEGYWGSFDGNIYVANDEVDAKVNDLRGIISNLSYQNWTFRASYHQTDAMVSGGIRLAELSLFGAQLRQLGFTQSADSLCLDGLSEFYQISVNYENLNYFILTEFTQVTAEFLIAPKMDSYFVSAGYNFYPFTSYISVANNRSEYGQPATDIPIGVAPELDALAFGYQAIFGQLSLDSSTAVTLGTRWDWKSNIAFKAEVTFIEGDSNDRAFFNIKDTQNFDREATLYQLAMEWVF